ncbi:TetR/AcrR family transcriptional regulator [Diaphorobacter aerolatus]|uniref:TetR/AcrR family transcriptional regulator n=2 Tax=Diaphorobacter aerolatus TaxID=1288495 RepID=A0A7H0GQ78_9BURK|nr:TetR/AcrR family transcriptional regulator [Diaphorobacter aerolatus]
MLLDAAAKAFTVYGFAAASIDVIAREINATKGSVYYHYRSKAELFFAVHKRAMLINLRTQLPIVSNTRLSPLEMLHEMTYHHAMVMMDYLYYQRVTVQGVELHQSISTTPYEREALTQVIAMRDAYESLFDQVVHEGVMRGQFEVIDASVASKGILGSLNWITMWYRPRDGELPSAKQRIAKQLAQQVTHGVAAQAASSAHGDTRRNKAKV